MKPLDRAIAHAQGVGRLARRLGIGQTTVSQWRARGRVPAGHCAAIEQATDGAVSRWDLRPDDWHRIWPELVGTEGAPQPREQEAKHAARRD